MAFQNLASSVTKVLDCLKTSNIKQHLTHTHSTVGRCIMSKKTNETHSTAVSQPLQHDGRWTGCRISFKNVTLKTYRPGHYRFLPLGLKRRKVSWKQETNPSIHLPTWRFLYLYVCVVFYRHPPWQDSRAARNVLNIAT